MPETLREPPSDKPASPSLMSFEPDPGHAPVLRYDIPSATEIETKGWLPISVDQSAFRDNLRRRPSSPPYAVIHHPTLMGIESPGTDLSKVVYGAIPTYKPARGTPEEYDWQQVVREYLPQTDAVSLRVRLQATSALSEALLPPTPRYVVDTGVQTFVPTSRRNLWGNLTPVLVSEPAADLLCTIYIVEHYRLASFLGDYGATTTVATFSLLPGEQTTITLSQTTKVEETKSKTTNILDSQNDQSSAQFENQVSQQDSHGLNTSDQNSNGSKTNSSTDTNASVNVHGSFCGFGGGASADSHWHNSEEDTHSDTETRAENMNTLSNAMDHHVNQTSSARTYTASTGTQDTATTSSEQSNVTTRVLSNINRSRVLNFVVRQLSQQFHTVTYLRDVTFVFSNGIPSETVAASLNSLDLMLDLVLIDDTAVKQKVRARLINSLFNISDYSGISQEFIKSIPDGDYRFREEGDPLENAKTVRKHYRRKTQEEFAPRLSGGQVPEPGTETGQYFDAGNQIYVPIDGIILDVKTRLLKTNEVIIDALLGQGVALDDYNVQLQKAAVEKQQLENQKTALALSIVANLQNPTEQAALFREVFLPPTTPVSLPTGSSV